MKIAPQKIFRHLCRSICFGDTIRFSGGAMVESDFFHDTVNRSLARDMDAFRLLDFECLLHADSSVGVITFIIRMNLHHAGRFLHAGTWRSWVFVYRVQDQDIPYGGHGSTCTWCFLKSPIH